MNTSLLVQKVTLDSLAPDPANARLHPDGNLDAIVGSLRRFGQAEPLVIQKGTRRVIAGHGRLLAMRKLGWTECDVVELDVTNLDATALAIALNRTAELAEWDDEVLSRLLAELRTENAIDGVGFGDEDIDRLIAEVADAAMGEVDEDVPPEPMDDPVTKRGDLWVLGDHRLLCGDSASRADVERLLGGARIQLVNTDPPYNVKVEPRSNNAIAAGLSSFTSTHHQSLDLARDPGKSKPTGKMRAKDRPLMNDFVSEDDFERMLLAWFGNLAYAMEPGASFFIWGGYANCANYPPALKASGLYFSQAVIWVLCRARHNTHYPESAIIPSRELKSAKTGANSPIWKCESPDNGGCSLASCTSCRDQGDRCLLPTPVRLPSFVSGDRPVSRLRRCSHILTGLRGSSMTVGGGAVALTRS